MGCQLLHLSNRGRRIKAYFPAHQHLQQVASNSLNVISLQGTYQFKNLPHRLSEPSTGPDAFSPKGADRFDQLECLSEFIEAHPSYLKVIGALGDLVGKWLHVAIVASFRKVRVCYNGWWQVLAAGTPARETPRRPNRTPQRQNPNPKRGFGPIPMS